MISKRFFLIAILLGCFQKKDRSAPVNWEIFSIYEKGATIKLPPNLFTKIDTSDLSFEANYRSLFVRQLYSKDSLSSIFVSVDTYDSRYLTSSGMIKNLNEMGTYYRSIYDHTTNFTLKEMDTLKIPQKKGLFYFVTTKNNVAVAVGGLLAYDGTNKYDLLIILNNSNIDSVQINIECILNSFSFPNESPLRRPS